MNNVKLRDAKRTLKQHGFYLEYIKGDHYRFKNGSGAVITLPFHINRGYEVCYTIYKQQLKNAGIILK